VKREYYYLVSSLPSLSLHDPLPLDGKGFLAAAGTHLSRHDYETLISVSLTNAGDLEGASLSVARLWLQWERLVGNELVKLRAAALGVDPAEHMRGDPGDGGYGLLAGKIFNTQSPMDARTALDEARWRYIEALEWGHYFDIESLALYYLKIQILERRALFDRDKGMGILSSITQKAGEDSAQYVESWKDTERFQP